MAEISSNPEAEHWYEVQYRETGTVLWNPDASNEEPTRYQKIEEAKEVARMWTQQTHEHIDGRTIRYDARVFEVSEQRQIVWEQEK